MIEFQDALKKSRAYNLIKHDIDTSNLSHAYMVISPDVFAVQNLFRLLACAVYCKDACTTCPVCKKVLNGNHADVKFINEDGKKIKVEEANETLGYKIRKAQMEKVPYMLIVGDKEMKSHTVSIRSRKNGDEGSTPVAMFVANLIREIKTREG